MSSLATTLLFGSIQPSTWPLALFFFVVPVSIKIQLHKVNLSVTWGGHGDLEEQKQILKHWNLLDTLNVGLFVFNS